MILIIFRRWRKNNDKKNEKIWEESHNQQQQILQQLSELKASLESSVMQNQQLTEELLQEVSQLKEAQRKLGRTQYQANALAEAQGQNLKQSMQQLLSLTAPAHKQTLHEFLQVMDGLEEGLAALAKLEEQETAIGAWLSGFQMVHQRLTDLLGKWQVRPMKTIGEKFDPHYHEAVDVLYSNIQEENIIVEEQRRGYLWGDEVLRYAEVVVTKANKGITSEYNNWN